MLSMCPYSACACLLRYFWVKYEQNHKSQISMYIEKRYLIIKQWRPVGVGHGPGQQEQVSGRLRVVCWFELDALGLRHNQQ